jgi:XTP/dITP diphosphohydrolase
MRLYVATSNPGKLRDFAYAASAHAASAHASGTAAVEILPLPLLASIPAPPEDEPTFAGNARAKARYYAREAFRHDHTLAGALVLADDSGLEVDALHGAPGVRSARFADDLRFERHSPEPTDARNNAALLQQFARTPPETPRTARYRCVLALARASEVPTIATTADGALEGEILPSPRGGSGFGYDPLFLVTGAGRTMAELDMEQRLQFSHRGRALRRLLDELLP